MSTPEPYLREERRVRWARRAAWVLAVPALALVIFARLHPESLSPILRRAALPVESADLRRADAGRGWTESLAAQQVQDTIRPNPAAGAITTRDTTPPPRRRRVVTDVVLLPCSTQNPRPDGSFIIPPHNPRHRTIVGLPSAPGEPRRGFIVPPHDPGRENLVPIKVISMDSILEQSLQVPPHDPKQSNVVRPYAVPCLADSTGR